MKTSRNPRSFLLVSAIAAFCGSPALAAEKPPLAVTVSAGAEYDSNVSIEQSDVNTRQGDVAALLSASADWTIVSNRKASLRVGYDFEQTLYEDKSDFDLQIHGFSTGGSITRGKATLGVDYQFSHVLLGGDKFLDIHMVSPSVGVFVADRVYVRAAYTYWDKSFATSEKLDARTHTIGGDIYRFFGKRKSYVALGVRYDDEDADGAEYRYRAVQGTIRAQMPVHLLGMDAKARFSAALSDRNYRNDTPSIGKPRRETRSTWNAALDLPLSGHISLKPQFRFIDRISNLPVADYREYIGSTSLQYRF